MPLIVTVTREFGVEHPFHKAFNDLLDDNPDAGAAVAAWLSTDGADWFMGMKEDGATDPEWDFQMVEDA